jgi:hypothetical protein
MAGIWEFGSAGRFLFFAIVLGLLISASRVDAANPPGFTNSVTVGNFTVSYPDGWSTTQGGGTTTLINVTPDKLPTLDSATANLTPQIQIYVEQRTDHNDALKRLSDISTEYDDPVTQLTIGGWPAIQRRHTGPREQPGGSAVPLQPATVLTITTAIAAGNQLIRLEGRMPGDVASSVADQVAAIETAITFSSGSSSADLRTRIAQLRHELRDWWLFSVADTRMKVAWLEHQGLHLAAQVWRGKAWADEEDEPTPPLSFPGSGNAGAVIQVFAGGVASEPEVAVSSNGRQIVVAQQFVWTWSSDGGQTFTFGGSFPGSNGGDSSLAWGKSGTFYEGTIKSPSTGINASTDGGQTFTARTNPFTCPGPMGHTCGAAFPDQEHIGADRVNQVNNADQVYTAWRELNGEYGISCSTDGGNTWGAAAFSGGDFPRVAVGNDGNVYVVFNSGNDINVNKYAACSGNTGMAVTAGFPVKIVTANKVTCPVPGLDRCNNGNDLRSFQPAVDDTNSAHIYTAYAVNTAAGNENVVIQDSTDGGMTWRAAVQLNGGGTARRFMPWVCATNGKAFVSWYDRRAANATDNDLTDYFGNSASLDMGGNLVAGTEFQINAVGTADKQCEAGKAVGSAGSWPGSTRNANDSESCSQQPQLAGRCGTAAPPVAGDSKQPCDFSGPDATACPNGMNGQESCQIAPLGGTPKYGDYNGNACAVGHFYTVWATANGPNKTGNIDLDFAVLDTVTPIATCQDRTVPTDPDVCTAANVSIDNGSTDPDNDTFTLSQSPPGPYSKGTTSNVMLTITDQNGQTNSCKANITVNDLEKPVITCLTPTVECTSPSGAVVAKLIDTVSDNCAIMSQGCTPPEGSTFALGMTSFTCTATDTSSNTNSCNSKVTVQDTTAPIIDSVSASPSTLWPPNHTFRTVQISASAHDVCDPSPKCAVTAISSNQPALGGGQGNFAPDFQFTTQFMTSPATLPVQLRAERQGSDSDRIYTITVNCKDASGNISLPSTTTVTVPHNQ